MPGGGRQGARDAVFLDRDGTIIEEVGYLDRVERVAFYPWTIDAVRALNRAGLRVVMVTNQSGVARGFFSEAIVEEVHRHIASMLEAGGARIDAYYYCPHHPDGKVQQYAQRCECRKPGRGLVDRAQRELGIDPSRSFVVGDRWLDVALARTVGAQGVLVRTGYGRSEEARPPQGLVADAVADNLIEAVGWILRRVRLTKCDV
ncbi:MAG: D,D-heptose 1,7-bisphosphate phosphatase [Acidobacteria bacterium]|nr:MAG: D,D-heptose 1,7-bisphosphate phosphatase [Acidobacteriota bacterium]